MAESKPTNPTITPAEVAVLVKQAKIPLADVIRKLTPAEKKAFIFSEFANDPEIIEVMGDPLLPIGGSFVKGGVGALKQLGPNAPLSGAGAKGIQVTKEGLGRVPRGGGIVKGSGQPATIEAKLSKATAPGETPPNLDKLGRKEFTEVEKRANMFGGAKIEGQAIKPNARQPLSMESEADALIRQTVQDLFDAGKLGGTAKALPKLAPKPRVKIRSPKK